MSAARDRARRGRGRSPAQPETAKISLRPTTDPPDPMAGWAADPSLDETARGHGRAGRSAGGNEEANLILIAHPRQRMLGSRYLLAPGAALEIGRSATADICLIDVPSVSRRHARIEHGAGAITIRDLESTNGTYVNDRRISMPVPLRAGDRFQVGEVHFKFLRDPDIEHAYHRATSALMFRDGLTNAYNRRRFDEEFERECARAARYGRSLSLILFDLDGFKSLNDRFGHLFGDSVLRRVAGLVLEEVRPEQVFARIGGDEFAILCPETSAEGARRIVERLRDRFVGLTCLIQGTVVSPSASFGVAADIDPRSGDRELFAAADRALYRSKAAGRGRLTILAARELAPKATAPRPSNEKRRRGRPPAGPLA